MYNYTQAAKALSQVILDNLPTGIASDKVKFPAAPFETPNGKHIRLSFTTLSSDNITPCWKRDECIFAIDLIYPNGSGQFNQIEDAENLRQALENQAHGVAIAAKAQINPLGEDGQYSIVQIQQNFYFEGK